MKLFTLLICLVSLHCSAQGNGYFGRKNVIEFSGHGAFPLFNRISNEHKILVKSGNSNSLVPRSNNFDGGFHLGVTHAFSNTFGIGLEFNSDFHEIQLDNAATGDFETPSGYQYTSNITGRYEHVAYRTSTFMIKMEFSGRNSLLPVGISHQLGIGRSTSRLIEKDYAEIYQFSNSQNNDTLVSFRTMSDNLNFNRKYRGLMIMYKVNYRTPVSKRIVLNYGVRFTLNITEELLTSDIAFRNLRRDRWRTISQLYFGIGLVY